DETNQMTARVPDRFLTVQWIRASEGKPTPALEALIKRLLAGEHTIITRPPMILRPGSGSSGGAYPEARPMPPLIPPFPATPGKARQWPRYGAEVIGWFLSVVWGLFKRAPGWARVFITIWL